MERALDYRFGDRPAVDGAIRMMSKALGAAFAVALLSVIFLGVPMTGAIVLFVVAAAFHLLIEWLFRSRK